MAYLSQQPDDDEQQKQQGAPQTLGGGSSASPMMGGGASKPASQPSGGASAAPQKSAMQGTGSNFVNLSSFLTPTVAKQNTEKVQAANTTMGAAEKQTFDKAADPLRNASFNAVQGDTRQLVDSLVPASGPVAARAGVAAQTRGEGTGSAPSIKRKSATPSPVAAPEQQNAPLSQLQSMLTQDYSGPMSVDYDASNKNAQQWSQLGNADTAINALNPENFTENLPGAQYGQGNRWLDEALIKGDGGTMGAISESKQAAGRFAEQAAGESKKLAGKAEMLKEEAAAERERRKGELSTYGDEMLGGIDARVAARNQQEADDYASGVVRDPETGLVVDVPNGQKKAGWQAGSGGVGQGATKGNSATTTERGRLGSIASLLGMDGYSVADEGQYQSGRYATERGDGYHDTAQLAVNEVKPNTRVNNTDDAKYTKDLTPEQKEAYRQIRSEYPNLTSAQAAEDAKNGTDENRKMFGSPQVGQVAQLQVKGVK